MDGDLQTQNDWRAAQPGTQLEVIVTACQRLRSGSGTTFCIPHDGDQRAIRSLIHDCCRAIYPTTAASAIALADQLIDIRLARFVPIPERRAC